MTGVVEIQRAVAAMCGITREEMIGSDKERRVSRPRQVAMFLSRKLTTRSYPEIGIMFRRHHSTIIYAVKTVPHNREMMRIAADVTARIAGRRQ